MPMESAALAGGITQAMELLRGVPAGFPGPVAGGGGAGGAEPVNPASVPQMRSAMPAPLPPAASLAYPTTPPAPPPSPGPSGGSVPPTRPL